MVLIISVILLSFHSQVLESHTNIFESIYFESMRVAIIVAVIYGFSRKVKSRIIVTNKEKKL